MSTTAGGSPNDLAIATSALVALVGWALFELRAVSTLRGGIRAGMVLSTTALFFAGLVVGIRGGSSGWLGAGPVGAFLGGLLVGLKGRVDLLVDHEYLQPRADGGAHPPHRQGQAILGGLGGATAYFVVFGAWVGWDVLVPE
ncbi:MAG: hypothetical protein ACT4QF_19675 [Sporichthyaceae bacterium]